MKSSDEIFQLVRSLSKQEKSYFKKFATAFTDEEGSNYLKLFDGIVKQVNSGKEYDELILKKISFTGKFLKNFSFHKNYLYNMVLSCLPVYHKDTKDLILIRNFLSQSELLYDKMLYEQSLKVLQKAKKLAYDKDKHVYLIDILNLERILYKYIYTNEEFTFSKIKELFEEQYRALDLIKNSVDYYCLNNTFGNSVRKMGTGLFRTEKENSELDKFFQNPLLTDINNAKTFFSRTLFNTMNMQYQANKNDYEKGYLHSRDNVRIWEENLDKAGGKIENYLFALYNLLITQVRTKRFDDFDITVAKLKDAERKYPKHLTEKNKIFIFYSISTMELSRYIDQLNAEGLENKTEEIRKDIIKYEDKIPLQQVIILYYFCGTSNFVLSKFDKCIYWMGKIVNLVKTDLSQDYQCYARIVYLISYYELGYFDSMEYVLKSVYHFISKRERIYKYENIILKYLRISFRLKSQKELYEMLIEMKDDLDKIKDDPFEQNAFDAFNITFWLESKIKKVPMINIMNERK